MAKLHHPTRNYFSPAFFSYKLERKFGHLFTSIVPHNDALIVILNVEWNRHIIAAIEQKGLNAISDRPGEAILQRKER